MVSAGGTGGGVYPALAIVGQIEEHADILWIGCEGGMERGLVERERLAFQAIPAAGIHGVGLRTLPGNLIKLARGFLAARKIIRSFKPDVILFTGGYVGVPVAFAGRGISKVAFVPDIEPGMALKWITKMADLVAVTTQESKKYYGSSKRVIVAGYPIRASLLDSKQELAQAGVEIDRNRPVLLVFGGSRGARSINQALWSCLSQILERMQVIHITGSLDWPQVSEINAMLSDAQRSGYHPFEYLHEEMAAALAVADLAISRAGASTLGEFPFFGLPAILVPYPYAWRYQKVNADYLVSHGAAIQLADESLTDRLMPAIFGLLNDPAQLSKMSEKARNLARPGAASTIAAEISQLAIEKGGVHG